MGDVTTGAVVLRADFGAYRRWFGQPVHGLSLIVGLGGISVGSALRGGLALLLGLVVVVTVVACVVGVAVHIATSRVTISDGHVEYRRWLRTTTLRRDDDLVGAVGVLVDTAVGRTSYRLVVRARRRGPRIWLNGAFWDHDDLLRVAGATGARVTASELTPREFERIAPGTMPWRTLHPVWFGAGGAVLVLAVVVGGVIGWFDVKDIPPFDEQPPRAVAAGTVSEQDALVADLQQAVGGRWAPAEPRLTTCQGAGDYKGWARSVRTSLVETVSESGEDEVVTPLLPTRAGADAIGEVLVTRGYEAPTDDVAEADDGYVTVRSYTGSGGSGARRGDQTSDVTVTFSRDGYAMIEVYGDCEVPAR